MNWSIAWWMCDFTIPQRLWVLLSTMASWAWKRHFRAVQSARGSGTQNGNVDVEANGYLQFSSIFPGKIGDLGVFTLQSIYPPFSETPRKEANTLLRVFLGVLGRHILSQPSWKNQLSWQGPHAIPLWGSWTNHRYGLRPTLFTSQTTWVSLDIHSHNFHLSLSESIAQPE